MPTVTLTLEYDTAPLRAALDELHTRLVPGPHAVPAPLRARLEAIVAGAADALVHVAGERRAGRLVLVAHPGPELLAVLAALRACPGEPPCP